MEFSSLFEKIDNLIQSNKSFCTTNTSSYVVNNLLNESNNSEVDESSKEVFCLVISKLFFDNNVQNEETKNIIEKLLTKNSSIINRNQKINKLKIFKHSFNLNYLSSYSLEKNCSNFETAKELEEIVSVQLIGILPNDKNVLFFYKKPELTMQDILMYSPYNLINFPNKQLFVVYQLVKMYEHFSNFQPNWQLKPSIWNNIIVDKNSWIKICYSAFSTELKELSLTGHDKLSEDLQKRKQELTTKVDLWIIGKISNYEYLMHLNELAGRNINNPQHYPVLPWVSDFSEKYGGWRDLSKSKYRLKKGDSQLRAQYEMEVEPGVPYHQLHHVPDMLSDITVFVYKARRTDRTILQKHVRSYWEPNEYPPSMERMFMWTPDECIPDFFTDPSMFKSLHCNMQDLQVPYWCDSHEDFIEYHKELLESDQVSSNLHKWIDVTFGYKLQGKAAEDSLNVCLQLVDQHTNITDHGITPLFSTPHPKKNVFSNKEKSISEISQIELLDIETYNPLSNLEQFETYYNFYKSEEKRLDLSSSLLPVIEEGAAKLQRPSLEQVVNECNILCLFCNTLQLYMLDNLHIKTDKPLSAMFEAAFSTFNRSKMKLPTCVRRGLQTIVDGLVEPETVICSLQSIENADREVLGQYVSLFKQNSSDELVKHPLSFSSIAYDATIFNFPNYFANVYDWIYLTLKLSNNYKDIVVEEDLNEIVQTLLEVIDLANENKECLYLVLPHYLKLLEQSSLENSIFVLNKSFQKISNALGPKKTQQELSVVISEIYKKVYSYSANTNESVTQNLLLIFEKSFITVLYTCFGLNFFLNNFFQLIINCIVVKNNLSETVYASLEWFILTIGPVLTSRNVIAQLFRVINQSFHSYLKRRDECTGHENILKFLVHVTEVYGITFFHLRYIPHISFTVSSVICKLEFTQHACAALQACVCVLSHFISHLHPRSIMQHIGQMSKEIIKPLIAHLSSTEITYPCEGFGRKALCLQTAQLLSKLSVKIGREMTVQLLNDEIYNFFKNFGAHEITDEEQDSSTKNLIENDSYTNLDKTEQNSNVLLSSLVKNDTVEQKVELNNLTQTEEERGTDAEDSRKSRREDAVQGNKRQIREAFCSQVAHHSYISLARVVGSINFQNMLRGHYDVIYSMYLLYENEAVDCKNSDWKKINDEIDQKNKVQTVEQVKVVGNKITFNDQNASDKTTIFKTQDSLDCEPKLNSNWLAYWQHSIGLPETEYNVQFNQIYLSSLVGHTNTIKSITVAESEDWLVTTSRDRTVRVWSLRHSSSSGEDQGMTYKHHKKTVQQAQLINQSKVVSCDNSTIHVWDPTTGQQLKCLDTSESKSSIVSIRELHNSIVAVYADSTARVLDARMKCLSQEIKTAVPGQPIGTVRCMCTSGDWTIMCGFTSGTFSLVDIRKSRGITMMRAHDAEVTGCCDWLKDYLVTFSHDQSMKVWDKNSSSGPLITYKSFSESITSFDTYDCDVISSTNSNKLMVHKLPNEYNLVKMSTDQKKVFDEPRINTKIRSDIMKGNITCIKLLPIKRQLVIGNDSGVVKLFA